jgi:arginyl-tRNA synthetase
VGRKAAGVILEDYIQPTVKEMGIRCDHWQAESELYKKYDIKKAIAKLRSQNLIQEKQGAIWFQSTKYGDDKDRVLKRKSGQWTYLASDMLYLIDRKRRGFDKIIMIWGADHYGYVGRYLALAQALGWEKAQIKIIVSQLVRLREKGQSLRVSKRAGRTIYLTDLVDKIGLDAARYFFLEKNPSTHLDFDVEKALKKDLVNPVYYVQYGYVRAQSILRKCQNSNVRYQADSKSQILNFQEKRLALKILTLPAALSSICQILEVYRLPHLALDLAKAWQQFYERERVIDEGKVSQSRLLLARKTRQALGLLLDLMGISKPEKM